MNEVKEKVPVQSKTLEIEEVRIKEKVSIQIKEEKARTQELSKHLRKQAEVVKPIGVFIKTIEEAESELKEALLFIERANQSPKLYLEESNQHIGRTKDMVLSVMNHWKRGEKEIKGYDFQAYLADACNQYFQEWMKEQSMEESLQIEVRNPRQFPSIFAIYHNQTELIQLNIFEKWYGIRENPSEEKVIKKYKDDLKFAEENILSQIERTAIARERRDHPLQYYKGVKNFFAWLFHNKKKIYDSLDDRVKTEEARLLQDKVEKERIIQYHPELLRNCREKRALIAMVEPFFKELSYELNANRNSLY